MFNYSNTFQEFVIEIISLNKFFKILPIMNFFMAFMT